MLGPGSLGDRKERGPPHEEPQRNLVRGRVVRGGDVLQHPAPGGARARKAPFMAEWAVGDDRGAAQGIEDARIEEVFSAHGSRAIDGNKKAAGYG